MKATIKPRRRAKDCLCIAWWLQTQYQNPRRMKFRSSHKYLSRGSGMNLQLRLLVGVVDE